MLQKHQKQHNPNWPKVPDYPSRILITVRSRSGKKNALLNLIIHQPDVDKIYWYGKNPYETKCKLLIKKRKV